MQRLSRRHRARGDGCRDPKADAALSPRWGRSLWGFAAFGAALAVIGLLGQAVNQPRLHRADAGDSRQVRRGEIIYRDHCAACHGAGLEGQSDWRVRKPDGRLSAPPHDARGHTWHHPDEQIFTLTKQGVVPPRALQNYKSYMPGFAAIFERR